MIPADLQSNCLLLMLLLLLLLLLHTANKAHTLTPYLFTCHHASQLP